MSLAYRHPFDEDWFVPAEGEWGNRASWRSFPPHAGADYNIPGGSAGRTIRAIAAGYIRGKGWHDNYGNRVWIEHDDGMWSHYAHMQNPSSKNNGDRVLAGTPIGAVGDTGLSFGAHLHLELAHSQWACNDGNQSIDPIKFIDSADNPAEPEEPMPIHHRKHTDYATAVGTTDFSRLRFSETEFDMATGAGGAGVYDITTHAYFTGLTPGKELTLAYWLLHASTGTYSFGFEATYPGVPSGNARIEFSTKITVPSGNHLFVVAKCPQGGVTNTKLAKTSLNYNRLV